MYVTISDYGAFLLRLMLASLYALNTELPHCFTLYRHMYVTISAYSSQHAPAVRDGMINRYVLAAIYCLHVSWNPDYQAYPRGCRTRAWEDSHLPAGSYTVPYPRYLPTFTAAIRQPMRTGIPTAATYPHPALDSN